MIASERGIQQEACEQEDKDWGWGHSQTEHGLHGDEQGRHIEGLKEHLCCLLPVLTGVQRGLC